MIPVGGGGWGRSDRLEIPYSGVLPKPVGMLPLSHMSWVTALRNSPQRFLHDLARRSAHLRVPNLLTSDQTTVNSLPECLADEVPLDGAGLDQVEDRSQRASKLVALCCLYVTRGQVGIMKYEDSRNLAVAPEVRRNGHVELRWIQIRQVVKTERRVVAVYALDFLIPVPGPQRPKYEFGPISCRKQGEPVNTAVLTDPVPDLDVVRMGVFGKSGSFGLLRGEEALLLLGDLKEPPRCFAVRLGHNIILQLSWHSINHHERRPASDPDCRSGKVML